MHDEAVVGIGMVVPIHPPPDEANRSYWYGLPEALSLPAPHSNLGQPLKNAIATAKIRLATRLHAFTQSNGS